MARPYDTGPHDPWRVRVTGEDVRSAFDAWWTARCAGAPADSVDELRDDLLRLARARIVQGSRYRGDGRSWGGDRSR